MVYIDNVKVVKNSKTLDARLKNVDFLWKRKGKKVQAYFFELRISYNLYLYK